MLASRIKDPGLSELDNKIARALSDHRKCLALADNDASYLVKAQQSYDDMDALLELRRRATTKAR